MELDYNTSLKGKVLKGHYRIDYKAAQGGMSWLYKVTHVLLNEEMALKLLYPQLTEDPRTRSRFIDEAKIQYRLSHPNIVRVTEIIQEKQLLGIVQEWINGTDLKSYLRHCSQLLTRGQLWYLMRPILEALEHAHSQGIVHRDIKPSNILLSQQPQSRVLIPKLSDFGVAKMLTDMEDRTSTGMMIGTVKYVAPEQIRESKTADRRADIYSVGVMLYQLATGRFPFTGPLEKVLYQHLFEAPKPPSNFNESVDEGLDEVILKCLAKEPDERFQNCRELLEALEAVMPEPEPVLAHPPKPGAPHPGEAPVRKDTNDASLSDLAVASENELGAYDRSRTGSNIVGEDSSDKSNKWLSDSVADRIFTPSGDAQLDDTNARANRSLNLIETSHGPVARPKSLELPLDEFEDQPISNELPSATAASSQAELVELPPLDLNEDEEPLALDDDELPLEQPGGSSKAGLVMGIIVAVLVAGAAVWFALDGSKTDPSKPPVDRRQLIAQRGTKGTTPAPRRVVASPPRRDAATSACSGDATRSCYPGPAGTQGKGICKAGTQTCEGGTWGPCKGAVTPKKERCNERDDNCDGQVDEAFKGKGRACYSRKGMCRYKGTKRCHSSGRRLRCASLRPTPSKGSRFVTIKLQPDSARFLIRYRGQSMRLQGKTCLEAKGRRRITISSSRYQMCVFTLSATRRNYTLKMKPKSDLEDEPNYCMR